MSDEPGPALGADVQEWPGEGAAAAEARTFTALQEVGEAPCSVNHR